MSTSCPLVYVIVLTFNHCQDTLRALDSITKMTYSNYQILVVDNRSTDETVACVRAHYPDIELLINSANLGYAGGVNRGLMYVLEHNADLVLVMNNDVVVDSAMLTHLVAAMQTNVGAAAPLIYYQDTPEQVWSAGFSIHTWFLEMTGGARGQVDRGQWTETFQVDLLLGCAILLQCSALKEIGLFDERFFFYFEDLDLSLRLGRQGYSLVTVPDAKMWHKVAGSAGRESEFRIWQMARSNVIFYRTHAQGIQKVAGLLFRTGSALKKSLLFLMTAKFSFLRWYWQGVWDGWQAS